MCVEKNRGYEIDCDPIVQDIILFLCDGHLGHANNFFSPVWYLAQFGTEQKTKQNLMINSNLAEWSL